MAFHRNTFLSILLVFSLAFNLAFAGISAYYLVTARSEITEADEPKPPRTRTSPWQRGRGERLGLTDEQREMMEARRERLREKLREEREKAAEVREKFIALLEDPDADEEEIAELAEEYHGIQQEMRRMVFRDLLQLREMLDSEQRKRLGRSLMRHESPEESPQWRRRRPAEENGE